ncbi:MAG TPA: serine hydrolase domain-containing protein [Ilumatobacter sp.]|nr:serine hydrolase domain-containing protein [Ilumatobacter sp.]
MAPVNNRATIDALVSEYGTEHDCPSISWGILADGELTMHGAYRSQHPTIAATNGVRPDTIDQHTVYRIASMTKAFSAAATLLLRDEGVLRLDDPIAAHAPELANLRGPTSDSQPLTVRDLLTMRAGFVNDDYWADRALDLTDDEFDAIVEAGVTFAQPTGVHEYSNFGFGVLGRVIHRASGQRIQQIISERLLSPLGMTSTTWVQPDHDRWARPLDWHSGGFHDELPPLPDGLIAPMGGLWTTVHDLATWVAWLDDAFPARDGDDAGPLSRASRREMQNDHAFVNQVTLRDVTSPASYGYGVRVIHEAQRVITHSGGLPGYGSNMRWIIGTGVGAIAFANSTYAPMAELTARILDIVLANRAVAPASRAVTPAVAAAAHRLVELFNDWSDDVADALFTANAVHDESYERRRAPVAGLLPVTLTSIEASSDASATITVTAADGSEPTIWFALSPVAADRIQAAEVEVEASGDAPPGEADEAGSRVEGGDTAAD